MSFRMSDYNDVVYEVLKALDPFAYDYDVERIARICVNEAPDGTLTWCMSPHEFMDIVNSCMVTDPSGICTNASLVTGRDIAYVDGMYRDLDTGDEVSALVVNRPSDLVRHMNVMAYARGVRL